MTITITNSNREDFRIAVLLNIFHHEMFKMKQWLPHEMSVFQSCDIRAIPMSFALEFLRKLRPACVNLAQCSTCHFCSVPVSPLGWKMITRISLIATQPLFSLFPRLPQSLALPLVPTPGSSFCLCWTLALLCLEHSQLCPSKAECSGSGA